MDLEAEDVRVKPRRSLDVMDGQHVVVLEDN
jgi:hypothetical protein